LRTPPLLAESVVAAGAEIVTVAVRRADHAPGGVLDAIRGAGARVLPNTAGCRTARDAVATAQLAREAFETDWVKLELVGDRRTLLPDAVELLRPAETLVRDDFVLADTTDDPARGRRLEEPAAPRSCRSAPRSGAGSASATPTRSH